MNQDIIELSTSIYFLTAITHHGSFSQKTYFLSQEENTTKRSSSLPPHATTYHSDAGQDYMLIHIHFTTTWLLPTIDYQPAHLFCSLEEGQGPGVPPLLEVAVQQQCILLSLNVCVCVCGVLELRSAMRRRTETSNKVKTNLTM